MKLNTKMLLYIITTSTIIFSTGIGYITFRYKANALNEAKNTADAYSREYSNIIKASLDNEFGVCRGMTQSLFYYDKIDKQNQDSIHIEIMKNVLLKNNNFIATFLQWDYSKYNPEYKKEHGRRRFIYYKENPLFASKNNNKNIEIKFMEGIVDTSDYDPENPYYIVKNNHKEFIINPYFYSYNNVENMPEEQKTSQDAILETTIIIPIFINNEFHGIAGCDIPLNHFQKIISEIKPYAQSYAFLLGNNGKLVAHPNSKKLGIPIEEILKTESEKYNIIKKIQNGEQFSFLTHDSITNSSVYITFSSIKIANTTTPWSIAIAVPVDIIMQEANIHFYTSIAVGIVGLLFLTFIIWIISKSITKPIIRITKILENLSQGKIDNSFKLEPTSKDEIGEMTLSASTLIEGLIRTSTFAKKIGEGDLNAKYTLLGKDDTLGKSLIDMRKKLKYSNKQIEAKNIELEKLSLVARETDNAIIILNQDAEIEWANEAYEKMFGFSISELKEKYGTNLSNISENPDIEKHIQQCISTKKSVDYITLNTTKQNKKIWVHTILTPILNSKNIITRLIAISSDITEIKLAEQNVKDSIVYASRIQNAILPSQDIFSNYFSDYFVLFKPRDIVSGDFYWAKKVSNFGENTGEHIIFAVADCTGHGVPGAFVSMLGISMLNEIVNRDEITSPSNILEELRILIKNSFKTDNYKTSDGMDISLCAFDVNTKKIQFAGAYNSLLVIKNNNKKLEICSNKEITKKNIRKIDYKPTVLSTINIFPDNNIQLYEIRGNRQPIGKHLRETDFNNYTLQLEKGDKIYLFSDGYPDQFGEQYDQKFQHLRFKQLVIAASKNNFNKQKNILDKNLIKWQGNKEQTDDILVIGIKI